MFISEIIDDLEGEIAREHWANLHGALVTFVQHRAATQLIVSGHSCRCLDPELVDKRACALLYVIDSGTSSRVSYCSASTSIHSAQLVFLERTAAWFAAMPSLVVTRLQLGGVIASVTICRS